MSSDVYQADCLVAGAGVVGLATAAEFARRGLSVLVAERERAIGTGVSSRNSEVIHAGLYYATGSLRHRLCVDGRRRLYAYLARRGVAHRKLGKLVVAAAPDEDAQIAAIHERALANGVEGVALLTSVQARALEPNLRCAAALLSPETGIVDAHGLMLALKGELEDAGGAVALNAPVEGGAPLAGGGFEMRTGGAAPARVRCRFMINAAALGAQKLAAAIEGVPAETIPPLKLSKGSYFSCTGKAAFSRLIYPAPSEGGLGIHLTLDLGGRMRFGPDIEWLEHGDPSRFDYAVDPAREPDFAAAIRRFWPGLPDGALAPGYAGCRPRLFDRTEKAPDFRIDGAETHGLDGLVNLFGIESPGLTSCLALGEAVANRAMAGA